MEMEWIFVPLNPSGENKLYGQDKFVANYSVADQSEVRSIVARNLRAGQSGAGSSKVTNQGSISLSLKASRTD